MIQPEDLDDVSNDVANQLFNVWANAYVAGYASAVLHGQAHAGATEEHQARAATVAEHLAQHHMMMLTRDPAAMHHTVASIRHIIAGCRPGEGPPGGIYTVYGRNRPPAAEGRP